jgi:hypothetical protein
MAKGNKHQQMFMIGAGALVVLAAAGLGVSEVMTARSEAAALAAAWAVTGPACPTADHPTPPPRSSLYEGVTFSRQVGGQVSCNTLQQDGAAVPACMFIGPGALRVATPAGVFDYAPGAGVSATVFVRDGQPECVTAINQNMFAVGGAR